MFFCGVLGGVSIFVAAEVFLMNGFPAVTRVQGSQKPKFNLWDLNIGETQALVA